MSGIYIKGMELPGNCCTCPFCDYAAARCYAVKGNPYTPTSRYEERAVWCPLIPAPDYETVNTSLYDVEETHSNCTVQILRNSVTGEISVGWWENE